MKMMIAALALGFAGAPVLAQTVADTTTIVIPDSGEVTRTLNVSGIAGNVTGLTLTLNGLGHTYPDDLVFGIVNDTLGIGLVFMSGVGGSTNIGGVDLTFSDSATGFLPESFVDGVVTSGTYRPSNFLNFAFNNFTNATSFSAFNGASANGAWTLYIDDTFAADTGTVAGGWALNFTTDAGAVPEPASWLLMISGFGLVGAATRRRRVARSVVA